jgi:hypothetical protein
MDTLTVSKTDRGEGVVGPGHQLFGSRFDRISIELDVILDTRNADWIRHGLITRLAPGGRMEIT